MKLNVPKSKIRDWPRAIKPPLTFLFETNLSVAAGIGFYCPAFKTLDNKFDGHDLFLGHLPVAITRVVKEMANVS